MIAQKSNIVLKDDACHDYGIRISYIKLLIMIANIIIGAFFPLISFWFSICAFSLLGRRDSFLLKFNFFICAFFSAVVYASRGFFLTPSDDYIRYYEVYRESLFSWYNLYFSEPGVLLFYNMINIMGGGLSVAGLAFLTSFLTTLLVSVFFYWLVNLSQVIRYPGLCLTLSFSFISFDYLNQLVRQSISLSLLLLLLIPISRNKKLVSYLLASMFHFSSIVIGGVLIFLRHKPLTAMLIFTIVGFSSYFLIGGLSVFSPIALRLEYYQDGTFEFSWYMKYIFFILFSMLVMYVFGVRGSGEWFNFLLATSILICLISPLGLISLRVFLFYIAYLIGLHLYIVFERTKQTLVLLTICVLVFKLYRLTTYDLDGDVFSLWRNYEPYAFLPFYYFLEY